MGKRQQPVQGQDVFPIPGTKRIPYLEENVAAMSLKLSSEDKHQMEALFAEVRPIAH